LYFVDHNPELAAAVRKGRGEFVSQFPSVASDEMSQLAAPEDEQTFLRSKLDWCEFERHEPWRRLHTDLISLRHSESAFSPNAQGDVDGAVLASEAFAVRFFGAPGQARRTTTDRRAIGLTGPDDDVAASAPPDRLLLINLGPDLVRGSFAEPLLAPPERYEWQTQWSSEAPIYGGGGTPRVTGADGWRIPGHAAVVLRPEKSDGGDGTTRR
jgi:maltooligosyltrehalose trehalohydrolase